MNTRVCSLMYKVKAGTCVHHKNDHQSDLPYKAGTYVYHMKNNQHAVYSSINLKLLALVTELRGSG